MYHPPKQTPNPWPITGVAHIEDVQVFTRFDRHFERHLTLTATVNDRETAVIFDHSGEIDRLHGYQRGEPIFCYKTNVREGELTGIGPESTSRWIVDTDIDTLLQAGYQQPSLPPKERHSLKRALVNLEALKPHDPMYLQRGSYSIEQ